MVSSVCGHGVRQCSVIFETAQWDLGDLLKVAKRSTNHTSVRPTGCSLPIRHRQQARSQKQMIELQSGLQGAPSLLS